MRDTIWRSPWVWRPAASLQAARRAPKYITTDQSRFRPKVNDMERGPEKKRKSEKTAWELNLKSAVASADLRKFRTTERSKPSDHIVLGKTCDQR